MPSPRVDTTGWPTRELILLYSSHLFATRGFLGTSTRDIAAAVGIRQPSVYNHFASKQEIAQELLRRDLTAGIAALKRIAVEGGTTTDANHAAPEISTSPGGGAAVELYRYLLWEVTHVRATPFDLRSIYLGEILELPEFDEGRRLVGEYEALIADLLHRGVASGEFRELDAIFARRAIDALVMETIRGAAQNEEAVAGEPDLAASFVLRALLQEPARLSAVQAAAHLAGL